MIKKIHQMTIVEFLILKIKKKKELFSIIIFLSLITSIIIFFFQPRTLIIIKSLQPLSKLSDTNVIFKKTNQDPKTVLEEYMFILRTGILKSNFYNILRSNKKLTEDEIIKSYDNFSTFRTVLNFDNKRLKFAAPLYRFTFKKKLNFAEASVFIFNKEKKIKELTGESNEYLIENLSILTELVKHRILTFFTYSINLSETDHLNRKFNVFELKGLDEADSFLITKSKFNLTEEALRNFIEDYGKHSGAFVEGIDDYRYEIEEYKFYEIIFVIVFIFSLIFYLFHLFNLKIEISKKLK